MRGAAAETMRAPVLEPGSACRPTGRTVDGSTLDQGARRRVAGRHWTSGSATPRAFLQSTCDAAGLSPPILRAISRALQPRQWGHMISFRLSTLRARGDPRLSPGGVCRKRAVARHGLPVQRGAAPGMEIQVGKIVGDTTPLMSPAIMGSSILLGIKEAGDMLAI